MQLLGKTDGLSVAGLTEHKTKRAPGYWCKILLEKLKLSYSVELMLSPTTQLLSWTPVVDSVRLSRGTKGCTLLSPICLSRTPRQ